MNEFESRAIDTLRKLLGPLPAVDIDRVETSAAADFTLHLHDGSASHTLLCEMKSSGQPRFVRTGILELRNRRLETGTDATPVLIAPYLSPAARELCRENRVGFIDLEGNAWITFNSVSIDHRVPDKPIASRKGLKSLFRPKSLQMIQVMLRDPSRQWRVAQLAQAAGISLGHASNVRTGLLNQEWAQTGSEGFYLCDPQALLDTWAHTYEPPLGEQKRFYTTLHGDALERATRTVFSEQNNGRALFCSYSAAQWLAPYARINTHYFYADDSGLQALIKALHLTPTSKGENVVITVPKDKHLLLDAAEPAPGILCSNPVQTYLDLSIEGERGKEAADFLRQEALQWPH